ncbi:rhodanese-like domain-containing protein [uncultured Erythrobacter sp.]|uniref:rhodanese-like domain-containing protein n=1 Tax=uncultured Erythrobacter sp. TaxID=263913 RepID=UPI0026392FA1|nr:rhodanese-like domain-containing protein [uncultured Erythrobacter sp.]
MKPLTRTALSLGLGLSLTLAACGEGPKAETEQSVAEPAPQSIASVTSGTRDVSIAEASALLSGEAGIVVLDVRTPEEFAAGHIEDAVNLDFLSEDFAANLAELGKDTTYVLHCKSGARSAKALEIMKEQGFESIAHMNEGFDAWTAADEAK